MAIFAISCTTAGKRDFLRFSENQLGKCIRAYPETPKIAYFSKTCIYGVLGGSRKIAPHPPSQGPPGAPGEGGGKSAHFFGYLITLPVGTEWRTRAGRDRLAPPHQTPSPRGPTGGAIPGPCSQTPLLG